MPTPTYTPLATVTLGASASSVTFSSIPATYRDLIFIFNGTSASGTPAVEARVNGDTGGNYNRVRMIGNGSTATSAAASGQSSFTVAAGSMPTSTVATHIVQFMDYSATDKHKTVLNRGNIPSGTVEAFAQRWANTAAITSISVFVTSDNFAAGSTFSLYGIVA
jgi:hypothetical protein